MQLQKKKIQFVIESLLGLGCNIIYAHIIYMIDS